MKASNTILATSLSLGLCLLGACGSIPVDQRAQARRDINASAEELLAAFIAEDPELAQSIDDAVGYFAGSGWAGMLGLFGGTDAVGVLYNKESETRTYLNINSFGLGVGVGASDLQVLALLESPDVFEQLGQGQWTLGAELSASAGESGGSARWSSDNMTVHLRSVSGALIGAGVELAKISVNDDLTDVGVSDFRIPNIGLAGVDRQGEDAPRIWPHKLPFLGQKVIDEGYDLPRPYGFGLIYVDIDQQLELTNLSVGFNGGEKQSFPFVSFENAVTDTSSYQLKFDAWILPFMNVFALLGKVDGRAPLDVVLDGNLMLEQLGTDCSGIIRPPRCASLQGQTFILPVTTKVDVTTYGIGTVIAGGWNNWFVAIPMTVTYADPANSVTDGKSVTITPRFGRVFNLGSLGRLALFVGGNHLDSDLSVDGTFIPPPPLEDLEINYLIDQQNTDGWNYLVGFNWDVNKHLSWTFEYNGFSGSREALISSFNVRF